MTLMSIRVKLNCMKKTEKIKCVFDGIKSIYEGEVANGKFNGYGTLKSAQGTYVEGNFKDNKLTGQGIYTNVLNTFSEFHTKGSGEHTSKGHERIIGTFKNNIIDGFSNIIYPNGDFRRVCFNEGKIDGVVIILNEEGSVYEYEKWKKGVTDEYENSHITNQIYEQKEKLIKNAQHTFFKTFEREFKEYGWYPSLLCSSKDKFKIKLEVWKEKYLSK